MTATKKIPLRERKYAQTKLALMNAALERLESKPLEEISVRELCDAATVSEATFFNYFPRKADLLTYSIQLLAIELGWRGRQAGDDTSGLGVIGEVFKRAAERFQQRPGLIGELIAHQARAREKPTLQEITPAERQLAFPDMAGIEDVPTGGLESILVPNLQQAMKQGELPDNTPMQSVMVALISIFYGVPLALRGSNPQGIRSMYVQQLNTLWAGIRSAAAGASRSSELQ